MCDRPALFIAPLRKNRDQFMSSGEAAMAYKQSGADDEPGYTPCVYAQYNTTKVPSAEHLGYTLGRTLGSGTYAKVKAAWSPYLLKMVSHTFLSLLTLLLLTAIIIIMWARISPGGAQNSE